MASPFLTGYGSLKGSLISFRLLTRTSCKALPLAKTSEPHVEEDTLFKRHFGLATHPQSTGDACLLILNSLLLSVHNVWCARFLRIRRIV